MNADPPVPEPPPPPREPAFSAPWPVVALVAALLATHGLRLLLRVDAGVWALGADDLRRGRLLGLVTYQFDHAGWLHVLSNAAATLAFGAPVARLMGVGPRGATAFFAFFVVCGVVAALGYAGLYPRGDWVLLGGSGAAAGLVGAAARLIQGRGRVGPLLGRTVLGMSAAWILVNVVLGLSGLTPGAVGVPVAWQAHLIGYAAGLLLITPFAWAAGGHAAITD